MRLMIMIAAMATLFVNAVDTNAQPMTPHMRAVPAMRAAPAVRPMVAPMKPKVAPRRLAPMARPVPKRVVAVPAMAPVVPMTVAMAPAAPVPVPVTPKAEPVPAPVPVTNAPQATTQAASVPKESGLDKATKWIELITKILLGLLAVIGAILGVIKGAEWRQALKSGRWAKILQYAREYGFPIVEKIAASTEWKGDDKLVEFLRRVDDWLKGEGDMPLSADETALLKKEAADLAAADKATDDREVDEKAVKRG